MKKLLFPYVLKSSVAGICAVFTKNAHPKRSGFSSQLIRILIPTDPDPHPN